MDVASSHDHQIFPRPMLMPRLTLGSGRCSHSPPYVGSKYFPFWPRMATPKISNWPTHLQYSGRPVYHSSVTREVRKALQSEPNPSDASRSETQTPCRVMIRKITNTDHPACGQCGLFAAQKIAPNSFILDYIGSFSNENDRSSVALPSTS
jgi:hypothetical protein